MDIAQGPEGLYVAGEGKISVYRCAPNGVFLRHLNLTPRLLKFSQFWGIYYCYGNDTIVTADRDYGVYVFKPSGMIIGHLTGLAQWPACLTIDKDGFVYVSRFYCNKIFIL